RTRPSLLPGTGGRVPRAPRPPRARPCRGGVRPEHTRRRVLRALRYPPVRIPGRHRLRALAGVGGRRRRSPGVLVLLSERARAAPDPVYLLQDPRRIGRSRKEAARDEGTRSEPEA